MSHPGCEHVRYAHDDQDDVRSVRDSLTAYGGYADKHRHLRADARESSKVLERMWRRSSPVQDIEQVFKSLTQRWLDDTAHVSAIPKIMAHPAYQQILGLGPKAVPLIFRAMQTQKPGHWLWALEAITRYNPVLEKPEIARSTKAIKNAWLEWGRRHGHI